MPIYEFRCEDCGKISDFLVRSYHESFDPICKHCESRRMSRLISRVRVLRSEESRLEHLADPSQLAGIDEKDPASVARWMKKIGREMGEDVSDEEIDGMIDDMRQSEVGCGGESDTPGSNENSEG